ncbi:RNA-directed DNA polymerase, eukaryota, partial [Tanacetum coccineum]
NVRKHLILRVEAVVKSGSRLMDREMESRHWIDAFSAIWTPTQWFTTFTTVIQVLLIFKVYLEPLSQHILLHELLDSGVDKDVEGGVMPNLIYVTREKRNNKAHNYKAGALNVMAETKILKSWKDGLVGAQYMGTGGFLNRHVISDSLSISVTTSNVRVNASSIKSKELLISAYKVASCDFEENTSWGSERTHTTRFRLRCEGWKSVFCNPKRAALVGVASVINLLSFLRGMFDVFRMGRSENLFVQIFIAGFAVVNSWPIYEGMVIRKDSREHFANRFAALITSSITFDSQFPNRLSPDQNADLERNVSYDKIKSAVWDYGTNKSPGPDGFTFEFYRKYWNLIDLNVVAVVTSFVSTGTFPPRCNSSFIALIPKSQEAKMVKYFRPISLIGRVYKIITKFLANRLSLVISELVSDVQSAFVSNRQILDGSFILNELLSWCKHNNTKAFIFKIEFEKDFDSVRWDYLDVVLNNFSFGPKWRSWIQGCLNSVMGSILINGSLTSEFKLS